MCSLPLAWLAQPRYTPTWVGPKWRGWLSFLSSCELWDLKLAHVAGALKPPQVARKHRWGGSQPGKLQQLGRGQRLLRRIKVGPLVA